MKRFLLFCCLAFCVLSAHAQCWANPGATWYYDYYPNYPAGYVKIERVGDTIIDGHLSDKLLQTTVNYNNLICCPADTVVYMQFYTYTSPDTVYFTRGNYPFRVLYAFNVPQDSLMGSWAAASPFLVDSNKTIFMFNQQMRILYVHIPGCWNSYTWIMDKIGCEKALLPDLGCSNPSPPCFGLRCYYDATGIYYSTHLAPYCDYTSHDTYSSDITIYPDPSGVTITSELILVGTHIRIYDNRGRLVAETEGKDDHIVYLPIAALSRSIYLLQIENGSESKTKKFMSY